MDLKLGKIVDDMSTDFFEYAKEGYDDLALKIKEQLGLDVYEASKCECSINAVNSCLWLFLHKIKEQFYDVLKLTDFKPEDMEFNYINAFILSVSRKRENVEFLKQLLLRENIISSFNEENGDCIIESKYGTILFRRALDEFKDEDLNKYLDKITIENSCHQIAEYLIKKYNNYKAVTAIAVKNICEEYFHSFILDGSTIIDIPNNIIMDKETYYELFMIEELNIVNYKEMIEQSKTCEKYDESKTLYPLLRNAMYIKSLEK